MTDQDRHLPRHAALVPALPLDLPPPDPGHGCVHEVEQEVILVEGSVGCAVARKAKESAR